MGLFQRLMGVSPDSPQVEGRYAEIRDSIVKKGLQQGKEYGIDIPYEPLRVAEIVPLPGAVNGEHYYAIADLILAEYPTELGLLVANAFNNMRPQLGFDPFGKIMVGMQFVDRKAGAPTFTRLSFMREHPLFCEYLTQREMPERTQRAIDLQSIALFQFSSAKEAKRIYPTLFIVPEMKEGVVQKMYSIDPSVAGYLTK